MKIRKGFVSNSSSSSFIIISDQCMGSNDTLDVEGNVLNIDTSIGTSEFGWENIEYTDTGSKIIFSYLQCLYSKNKKYLKMLEDVLKDNYQCDIINWDIVTFDDYTGDDNNLGFIDHQSSATEGQNLEMFESIDVLKLFLFCDDSYIQGGNDNG